MDERRDPGEFYPGGRVMVRPDVAPPQMQVRWSDIQGKPTIPAIDDTLATPGAAADAKATGDELAARPMKAQIDAGWWSEWTVSAAPETPGAYYRVDRDTSDWLLIEVNGALLTPVDSISATGGDEDQVSEIVFPYTRITATRHRVSAPVPTRPSDIGAASVADATLIGPFSAWIIEFTDQPSDYLEPTYDGAGHWHLATSNYSYTADGSSDAISLDFSDDEGGRETAHATRTVIGYTLGTQTDKPLQPKGDYAPATNIAKAALASDVQTSLGKADTAVQPAALADKLDSTAAAPAFSTFPSRQYEVGDYCTYNGKFYICKIPTTGGTWNSLCWNSIQLIKPPVLISVGNLASFGRNANLEDSGIPAASVATKGEIRYDLVTITTGQLQNRAVQKVTLNAVSTTLVLPALTDLTGKVADFGIDMVNAYAPEVDGTPTPTAATFQLDGTLGTDYNLIVPKGETWSDMTALAEGEMAAFYFTRSAFQNGDVPTWEVVKKVVEFVPVPSAP